MYYLEQILTDLEKFGLHVHCVPIFKFGLLLAEKVIQNKTLEHSLLLRFARCISCLGYTQKASEISAEVVAQFNVTPQEFVARFNELNRMRVASSDLAERPESRITRPGAG